MKKPPDRPDRNSFPKVKASRRDFLKISGLGVLGAAAASGLAPEMARAVSGSGRAGRGNTLPGRIVLLHDVDMGGHLPSIDRDQVEQDVHLGVRTLTGIGDTAAAFESLFPGLTASSTIAIKVNCLAGNNGTRYEVVRGIVSGLSLMLGGTYDVSQVTIYDVQSYLPDHGYVADNFTFGGKSPAVDSYENCSSYYVYGSHRLSNYCLDSDYLINVPVLKAHNIGYPQHQITTALKNHYGSICPQNLCNNIPGMLSLNSDGNIRDKTCLVATSAIWGTYEGGPWEPAQTWNTFAEQTPNSLFFTTDPVTEAYWCRDMINAERADRGWSAFPCTWVEEASGDPWYLGVSDPDSMTVITVDPYLDVETGRPGMAVGGTFLAPNIPNPFSRGTTLRFRLEHPGHTLLKVFDASGRRVRDLGGRDFPAGYGEVRWDGLDSNGTRVAAGVYFVRLEVGHRVHTRRVVVVR